MTQAPRRCDVHYKTRHRVVLLPADDWYLDYLDNESPVP